MTTATPAASQPAPDTAYTADEEARIIRNSSGLPVGIKPKMVWTWPKALLWAVIAIVCALAWSVLAIARGEQISAIWFVVVALSSYAIAYRFYAYYIQIKIMRTDDANATAAERVQDGANFERADRRVLFGQHFAAISGAGPLVGPILAAQMGYLPSVLWIILGVIFAGAVQDMLMLWISAKRRGRSFGQMATDEMGKVGGLIISVFLVVVTAIAMAFLALVAIKAMASSPWAVFSLGMTIPIALIMGCYERFLRPGRVIETTILGFVLLVLAIVGGGMIAANPVLAPIFTLNAKQLVVALVLYSFAAAALPHWLLVTPRDYLSTLMKIGTLALLVIGVVIANPQVQVPALTTLASRSNGPTFSGNLFPFLFITIACGALSGFHGAVSSGLTPKAIEKENQIRMIGYGSMLVESFTAIIALIAAITISQGVYFSMNMSPAQIEATAGSAYSASASPEQNAAAAVSRMDVQNIEGQRMRVEWQSGGTVVTGAEALDAAAHDVGEETLVSRTGGATTFAIGMANFLKSYLGGEGSIAFWYHFAIMFEALFILTTVDNGTRVARYQIGDLLGNVRKLRKFADPTWRPGNLITTFIATALWGTMLYMGVSDANGGINAMVPIFGISNQLLSAGCFMLVTVCVVKAGLGRYAWIPVVPLVWDVAVTFTADFEKIFDPQLGYFATASSLRASIDSGQLEGEALANAYASLSNAYLDGVLSVFFLVMMAAFLAVGVKTVVSTVRARAYGDHLTSQEPFLESNWFAPSGLIATRLERKVQHEFEHHPARRAELG
ncbi:carbon starvation protein CstA [Bifidobacterium pseudolongum subsp. globosum]|uniref:Carbon starvation protein CstA n=1 Tax=Bifidobacterium pseudolongum subsp. globosum TaxID=1690 RepID=A0A2N3QRT3_9BIFI|nr:MULTISPECIES: carbon starvation CstA family protein [Bifidobacterium]MCI6773887.1 carbon starvation protein A [Bifidobacterium pseudolongum]ATO39881.1 carbon starvation protein A [Bifidobacterium pseudolongum subsp. globosum DSM 20092]KFI77467.1 carbon starvation protein A [Bifidobacterium pseudolongum subsp. globosum]MBQ1600013.1 carbon starvation protein A [Bifidobacterium sp.]MEE1201777.1 carbon starvation CstA family protein [Bifidobacterium sp.]